MTDPTSQITMSNLPSTATEPIEEAVTSFVHSVRKYELRDQVYPLVGHTDYVHEFVASTTVLQQPGISHVDGVGVNCHRDERMGKSCLIFQNLDIYRENQVRLYK